MSSERAGTSQDAVIVVENLSKAYHIYDSPADRLRKALLPSWLAPKYRTFWALRDLSMEVRRGDAVGIIGRNGSGKSTLMQIIAGTLAPTSGRAEVRGRIAALLELGSGFNPRFTGRENIYLAGSILGITRREMDKRFDDIVEFAEIGDFLDQPVQVYSSGMHARLAFSVAISVEPDILILDEILSVGDMGFQQKCTSRIRQLRERGVTLLFVSHAPDAIKSVCNKGLLLVDGKREYFGESERAVNVYFSQVRDEATRRATKKQRHLAHLAEPVAFESKLGELRYGLGHAQVEWVRLLDREGRSVEAVPFGGELTIEVGIVAVSDMEKLDLAFTVRDRKGVDLFGATAFYEGGKIPKLASGERATVRWSFQVPLRAGNYGVCLTLTRWPDRTGDGLITLDHIDAACAFAVLLSADRPVRHKFHVPVRASCSRVPAQARNETGS